MPGWTGMRPSRRQSVLRQNLYEEREKRCRRDGSQVPRGSKFAAGATRSRKAGAANYRGGRSQLPSLAEWNYQT